MSDRVAPNLIPPRTSSTGVTKPTAEEEWFASSARRSCPGSIGYQRGKPFSTRRGKLSEAMWTAGKENIVLGPYSYTVNQPGKDIRGQLIAAYNRWLQVPEESLAVITKVIVMLHTASLL